MLADEYFRFKTDLDQKGVILSFSGCVSESLLFSLGDTLKSQLRLEDTDTRTEKRVFSIFVELVQNIIRYSSEQVTGDAPPFQLTSGLITVGIKDARYFIVCANAVQRQDVPILRERLDYLSGLDRDAIRAYYRQKLKEPADDGSKGASLGLIEIARRSSRPIEYDFADIDDHQAFFGLKAYI